MVAQRTQHHLPGSTHNACTYSTIESNHSSLPVQVSTKSPEQLHKSDPIPLNMVRTKNTRSVLGFFSAPHEGRNKRGRKEERLGWDMGGGRCCVHVLDLPGV